MSKEGNPQSNGSGVSEINQFPSPLDHSGLINVVAKKYERAGKAFGLELDDLRQVATEHFIRGAPRFDPEKGKVSTFMSATINGGVKKYFRDHGWLIHVPRGVSSNYAQVASTVADLGTVKGRQPTDEEVATQLGLPNDIVHTARIAKRQGVANPTSLSEGEPDEQPMSQSIKPVNVSRTLIAENGETVYDAVLDRIDLKKAFSSLSPRLQEIVRMSFGLRGPEMNQKEIAAELGISQMHVSRLRTQALAQLRGEMDNS